MRYDPKSNTVMKLAVDPAAKTSTFTEDTVIDAKGFLFARVIVLIGAVTGTTPDMDITISAGAADDGSDAVAITGATISNLTTGDADSLQLGLIDLKAVGNRYISVDAVLSGTTPNFTVGVIIELSDAVNENLYTEDTYAFSV